MPRPHGGYLAIVNPDATHYFVVDPFESNRPLRFSIVPSEIFKTMTTLRLPSDVQAPARIYGRDTTLEPVFTKAGIYEIRVGDNLESDYGPPPLTCRVKLAVR